MRLFFYWCVDSACAVGGHVQNQTTRPASAAIATGLQEDGTWPEPGAAWIARAL
jgi:hypothetical protein